MNLNQKGLTRAPKVAVAMLGARMHYAVPRLLYESGMLDRFFTDSYAGNKPFLEWCLRLIPARNVPKGILRWLGRTDAVLPPEMVVSFESLGIWYAWARSRAVSDVQRERIYCEVARRFSTCILKTGLGRASIVWGFNSASLELFQNSKTSGRLCILEQTILPRVLEQKLMAEESIYWPGWQPSLDMSSDVDLRIIDREAQEWALADCIVAGSSFVRDGLRACGVPAAKIKVVPYGVEVMRFASKAAPNIGVKSPLKILFAGEVGLRKGAPYLMKVLERLGRDKVIAQFAGNIVIDRSNLLPFAGIAEFLGPVPRSKMAELYQWADVFVLPSIVEGSATVTYEALLSGVPVITTPNAGSIVRDGEDGWIVPIRDVNALAEALGAYVNDRGLLQKHSDAALRDRVRGSLDRYKNDLVDVIRTLDARW